MNYIRSELLDINFAKIKHYFNFAKEFYEFQAAWITLYQIEQKEQTLNYTIRITGILDGLNYFMSNFKAWYNFKFRLRNS